jgi:hypothetical protein
MVNGIHKLINSICNKEELSDQWKESIIVPIPKQGDIMDLIIIMGYHCSELHTNVIEYSSKGQVCT